MERRNTFTGIYLNRKIEIHNRLIYLNLLHVFILGHRVYDFPKTGLLPCFINILFIIVRDLKSRRLYLSKVNSLGS